LRCLDAGSAQYLLKQAFKEVNDQVFVYERLIDAAQRLGADLPPVEAVLENCRRIEGQGLAAATKILLQSVLIEREDGRSEQVARFDEARACLEEPGRMMPSMCEALPEGMEARPVVELMIGEASTVSLRWEWAVSERQVCFRSAKTLPRVGSNPLLQLFWPRL